jgi:hypothetical protein
LVDLQLEGGLEKPNQTGLDAIPCPPTLADDQKVVTAAGEVVAAPFQFLLQVV